MGAGAGFYSRNYTLEGLGVSGIISASDYLDIANSTICNETLCGYIGDVSCNVTSYCAYNLTLFENDGTFSDGVASAPAPNSAFSSWHNLLTMAVAAISIVASVSCIV